MADVTTILNNGNSKNRVDIVFVAEGYTSAERAQFLADAQKFLDNMLGDANAKLNAPFSSYKNLFNASAIFVASAQSGTDQPNKNISVNTYFDATQHGSDGRLLYGDFSKVNTVVNSAVASDAHELVVVLVNTALYGGAGGSIAWASAGNISSAEVVLHEIGHSFAGLQDEYVDTSIASNYPTTDPGFLASPHVTDSLSRIPWSAWLGYKDGDLGVVGTYQGGYYRDTGIWRATQDSKMNHLGVAFSAPEKEAFALKYYAAIGDYLDLYSSIPGIYQPVVPDSSLLAYTWKIGGATVNTTDKLYFDAYSSGAYKQGASLSLTTIDNTGYIRKNLSTTQQTETTTLDKSIVNISGASGNLNASNSIFQFDGSNNVIGLSAPGSTRYDYIDGGSGTDTLVINATLGKGGGSYFVSEIGNNTLLLGNQNAAYWGVHNVEKIQFNDYIVNTTVYDNAHSIKTADLQSLEELYVAYFNRVPDADGMDYWVTQFKSGMTFKQIGDAFFLAAAQYPAQTGYTLNLSNTDFINIIYKNAMGRSAGADEAGLKYWLNELNTGIQSRGSMVSAVLAGARAFTGDATWGWVVDLLNNKIKVANQFSVEWGLNFLTPESSITNGIAIASAVTATDTSAAITLIGLADGQIQFT
ncbi:M64 family metallopeptidase [Undibacterium sp. TS12]|uniref:M64 family metallopeptidase n=1 Tax=Undibacterium sp. TS12 TaxID=2908202 RepID=UPI001F4C9831|nr:M64 family metallopeptidase [Undibacterium sp. TS12]MCH8617934.1 M64 family metallo-endopeptidase [Undibacterium sp. TS12]